jgi:hypothetical protein
MVFYFGVAKIRKGLGIWAIPRHSFTRKHLSYLIDLQQFGTLVFESLKIPQTKALF